MNPDVALLGAAQAGKDTVAGLLVEQFGYRRIAFADGVRELALLIDPNVDVLSSPWKGTPDVCRLTSLVDAIGWHEAKREPEVRRLLQRLGAGVRAQNPDYWVDLALDRAVDRFDSLGPAPLVFTDVRYENELQQVTRIGGVAVVVTRQAAVSALTPEAAAHESEQLWQAPPGAFYTITNDGTLDELAAQVDALATALGLRKEHHG